MAQQAEGRRQRAPTLPRTLSRLIIAAAEGLHNRLVATAVLPPPAVPQSRRSPPPLTRRATLEHAWRPIACLDPTLPSPPFPLM